MDVISAYGHDVVVVREGAAEVVELAHGGAFHLLVDGGPTGGTFSANRLTLGEGADGAKPHFHTASSELFYVLAGEMEFLLGERLVTAARGSLIVVPPRVHAFGAAPDVTADVLVIMAPGVERFEYFRQLGRIAQELAAPDSLLPEQDRFDVHFADSAAWPRVRTR
ncbi:cupin domain-containing protein [Nonomuraea sp. NPDC000554]|uniref:cupin domain-containing protein n=1 Tax=Nonomuraea sp. NPDC000554 TaxID=3154259 RepID=UPI0033323488